MPVRVQPELRNQLIQFGIGDWNACYHCGTCTAICPLSEEGFLFPRKKIRLMQMGLKDQLESSVEPWLVRIAVQAAAGSLSEPLSTTIFLRSGPMTR